MIRVCFRRAIKRRAAALHDHRQHHESEAAENRQSLVLFVIVMLFLVCNLPRIVLNSYEVFMVAVFRRNVDNACYRLPDWVMLTATLSLLLMTMNSSVNCFVYCVVNSTFRAELLARLPAACVAAAKGTDGRETATATAAVTARGESNVLLVGKNGNGGNGGSADGGIVKQP